MTSAPNASKEKQNFHRDGGWHNRDHIILFRDVGDGRCIIYISKIEPLFDLRTIGQHGVTWENIRKTSLKIDVVKSVDVLKALE